MTEHTQSPFTAAHSTVEQPKTHRVKLYKLDAEGSWEDQGTGHCVYKSGQADEADEIYVTSERDNTTPLLNSKVREHNEYRRQQETLIVWTEGNDLDLALSFEEVDGCEHIWDRIHEKPDDDDSQTLHTDSDHADTPSVRDEYEIDLLPSPELSNLPQIEEALVNAKTEQQKDRFASFIIPENYIGKLIALFSTCEELENVENLHKLHTIMKAIIMLNDNAIIERVVHDDIYQGVMGMLEYNPDMPSIRTKHRDFLAKCATIQPVVPIKDEETIAMIHETHRIKYVKEIIFSDSLNSALDSVLHSLIFFNDRTIICNILKNTELLSDLFDIFKEQTSATERKIEASKFVLQLCNMAKKFQAGNRASLYRIRSLCPYGFLDMFTFALAAEPESLRKSACHVLSSVAEVDTVFLRSQFLQNLKKNGPKKSLIAVLIDRFTMRSENNIKMQLFEIIRLLLDVINGSKIDNLITADAIRQQSQEAEEFIFRFFDDFATTTFLRPIDDIEMQEIKLDGPIHRLELTVEQGNTIGYLCELLCIAIKQHSHESRTFFTTVDLCAKIVQLYRCNQGSVQLAALKFIRACVGVPDNFYKKRLMMNNAFEPTIRMLLDTDGRDNLVNSVCLELFEFIRKENVIPLVNHLITRFGSVLDTMTYTETFKALQARYDQNQEAPGRHKSGPSGWSSSTANEEEEYFDHSCDEVDTTAAPSPNEEPSKASIPLVKYEGDEGHDIEGIEKEVLPLLSTATIDKDRAAKQDTHDTSDKEFLAAAESLPIPERKRKRDGEDEACADDEGDVPIRNS